MSPITETGQITVQTFKRAVGNPSYQWRNTYEMHLTNFAADYSAFVTFANAVVTAEKALHHNSVEYVKVLCSSWDGFPPLDYDPSEFVSVPITPTLGTRTISGEPLPRNIQLYGRKAVVAGRFGKVGYRGCLAEGDLATGTSLDATLAPSSKTALDTALGTFLTAFNNAAVTLGGANSGMALIRLKSNLTVEFRMVSAIEAGGISFSKPDHKYYDRA